MLTENTSPLDTFLQRRMTLGTISSPSLVFTFFCDVVTQHGGEIWLGSVIHALAPLGISERLTRTAVFRLVQDGWLQSRKQGRRSYYCLTTTGEHYYQRAEKRIYAVGAPGWDGEWTLIFASLVPREQRDALRKGLLWLGYGVLASGVFALPSSDRQPLNQLLADLELDDFVVQMHARAAGNINLDKLQKLVMQRWDLDDLKRRFADFTKHYSTALKTMQQTPKPRVHSLLLLRILLIHEYRKILLQDPELPALMMPPKWEGFAAQAVAAEIYRQLAASTARWINRELVNASGNMKGGTAVLTTRFSQKHPEADSIHEPKQPR